MKVYSDSVNNGNSEYDRVTIKFEANDNLQTGEDYCIVFEDALSRVYYDLFYCPEGCIQIDDQDYVNDLDSDDVSEHRTLANKLYRYAYNLINLKRQFDFDD